MLRTLAALLIGALMNCTLPGRALAGLAAHEVLVLVNRNSERSMEAANHFVHIRQVPPLNVVYLDVPERALEPTAEISPEDFARHIWEPARAAQQERGLEKQVLAWIYSVDFPVRITTTPPTSITGLTFLRNNLPDDPKQIDQGLYLSPLFAGPDNVDGPMVLGGSLVHYKDILGEAMPVPAMLLGHVGARGTDMATVIRTLQYGQAADRSAPRGTVYWLTGEDVRARIRAWQFEGAAKELKGMNVRTVTDSDAPIDLPGIIGLQTGTETIDTRRAGRHLPGSMAEHVTSFGAAFHIPNQTKLTDWLRAGATASAGAVSEPYAIWTKFPHARFFAHYARGNTMLESFYLSTRSPTQILFVGEPLARPWSPPLTLTLAPLEDSPLKGRATFMIAALPEIPNVEYVYRLYHNGKYVSTAAGTHSFGFDTRDIPDGHHELRAVAYARGVMAHSTMNRLGITVSNKDRAVRVLHPAHRATADLYEPLTVEAEADGDPVRMKLLHNERTLAEHEGGKATFRIDPQTVGPGPVQLQVRAEYDDESIVRSRPLSLVIERSTPHPDLRALVTPAASPDGRKVKAVSGTIRDAEQDRFTLEPERGNTFDIALFEDGPVFARRYSARMTVPCTAARHPQTEMAGLVFAAQDGKNFLYFMADGRPSGWTFGRCVDGHLEHAVARGALILRNTPHQINLAFDGNTVAAYVDGEKVATWDDAPGLRDGGDWGVLAHSRPTRFEHITFQGVTETDDHE